MADPFENFIDRLRDVFSDPWTSAASAKNGDATGFYAALALELREFSEEAMQKAAQRFICEPRGPKDGRDFPPIDRCVGYCKEETRAIALRKEAEARAKRRQVGPGGPSHDSFAEEQMSSDLARRAALGGWVSSFRDFCATHGRLPDEREIEIIRAARKRVLAFAEEQAASGSRIRVTAFQAMLRREENLSRRVLSEGEKVA